MIYSFIIAIISLSLNSIVSASTMDKVVNLAHLIVIPGKNGLGGENVNSILPQFIDRTIFAETPLSFPDFGQSRCMMYLDKSIKQADAQNASKIIIHASSQGTATIGNYLPLLKTNKIGAVILE